MRLTNLRDKQSIGKVGRRFRRLRFLKIQPQCASCNGAIAGLRSENSLESIGKK